MKIHLINSDAYVSLYDLLKLGFPMPKTGTVVFYHNLLACHAFTYFRFYEKKEGWDGIFISPFGTEIGKIIASASEIYIPFTPEYFTPTYTI